MQQGDLLWSPSPQKTRLDDFAAFLQKTRGLEFSDYNTLWGWSVDKIEDFWESIYQFLSRAARRTAVFSRLE